MNFPQHNQQKTARSVRKNSNQSWHRTVSSISIGFLVQSCSRDESFYHDGFGGFFTFSAVNRSWDSHHLM